MSSRDTYWAADAETKPAPDPLIRVQELVNTVELPEGPDRLADPADARPWLVASGLLTPDAELQASDLELLRGVRGALRAMLVHNAGGPAPTTELAPLREVASEGTARADFDDHGEVVLTDRRRFRVSPVGRAAADHPRRPAGRNLGAAEGVRERGVSVGVLRPVPQPRRYLVRNVLVRKQTQEPRVPRPQARRRVTLTGATPAPPRAHRDR